MIIFTAHNKMVLVINDIYLVGEKLETSCNKVKLVSQVALNKDHLDGHLFLYEKSTN